MVILLLLAGLKFHRCDLCQADIALLSLLRCEFRSESQEWQRCQDLDCAARSKNRCKAGAESRAMLQPPTTLGFRDGTPLAGLVD
jgi:hypothetical protein